ncbi:YbhB/YbcL family Raf kinase inhibitor-like protein [Halorientalis salina]|uniref:YbhB/YbcL family Raf kinase inhibitor-like protein n=1 Tax=Halorientalis salina TaxID=2932266 RepID=UPI0010ABCB57|nr:YbhB/YbcL family Raf kinase inhibitor-like protein [Halorientalis salina]
MPDLQLSSPAFEDGEPIPEQYGYTEANVNPPLSITGVPDEAESLVLIVDDPDAEEPAGKIWDHWLVWNVDPDTEEIPEDWSADAEGAVEGQNDYGEHGYGGPNPPDREHTYRFMGYALDTTLDLSSAADKDALHDAMTGHVLADATLEGTYAP